MKSAKGEPASSFLVGWYRAGGVVLLGGSSLAAGFVLLRSVAQPIGVGFVVWVLGMAAYAFGVVFPLLAGLSLVNGDRDQVDVRSALGLLVLTFGSVFAVGWVGLVAAGMLLAGWTVVRVGRRKEDRQWRKHNAERLAFYGRVRRVDPRSDPEAARFLNDPPPEDAIDGPSSRQAAIDRARRIDGDPWEETGSFD